MKKLALLLMVVLVFCACSVKMQEEKITIVTTLFPQYDFCRQIAGDKAEIILLLPPGMESHNYEPGVGDMQKICESDLFIYTGSIMEPWVQPIIESADIKGKIVDASENINICTHEHTEEEHHHHEEGDPHIWTNPENAKVMVKNILDALCNADNKNSDFYKDNAEKYMNELDKLNSEFISLGRECENIILCHGGNFSMTYLEPYGFKFLAAYDSCGTSQEPSIMRVKEIVDKIKEQKLKGVFCHELNSGRVAETISQEAGVPVYLLHSCHNLSKEEFLRGETYLSLMKSNAENIKKVIKDAES